MSEAKEVIPVKPISPIKKTRNNAKYAMAATMAVLVYTGLKRTKISRTVHIVAGLALVGLSVYHANLYKSK